MKNLAIPLILICMIYFSSCKKEEMLKKDSSFITSIQSDSDVVVVGSLQLDDGNFLIVSRDMLQNKPGSMAKVDMNGKVLWQKKASSLNLHLWKVFLVPGKGFATLGYSGLSTQALTVCSYNNDGDSVSTKVINTGFDNGYKSVYDVLQLKNGNFVFAGSDMVFSGNGYLKITDNLFNVLYSRTIPDPPGYFGYFIRGICEMPDSSIAFTASTSYNGIQQNMGAVYTLLLRTNLLGQKISESLVVDTGYAETPNCLANQQQGMFAVTSRKKGVYGDDGTFLDVLNNNLSQLILGQINLVSFNSTGQFINRKPIADYPGNGMINSTRPTQDGGFILCGTVDQASSAFIPSNTKIYLTKLDANLNQQWTKVIATTYPSYGIDAIPTADGGYFVSGHQKSFNKRYEMIAIKTDASGNIK